MKLIFNTLILLLIITACEKEVKFKSEEIEPRIVVNSLFEAGEDTIWVNLSESRDVLYEGQLPYLTSAIPNFLDANGVIIGTFNYDDNGNYYCTNAATTAGQTYGLSVSADGFNSVEGYSNTPSTITYNAIDTVRTLSSDFLNMKFNIQFDDDPDQVNYYGVSVVLRGAFDDGEGETYEFFSPGMSTREYYVINGSEDIDGLKYAREFYFSDETFNGQTLNFECFSPVFYGEFTTSKYAVTVRSMSEDFYKYKLTYDLYSETEFSPFAEPVQVYSNIENGFGIFGGSSTITDTIYVE